MELAGYGLCDVPFVGRTLDFLSLDNERTTRICRIFCVHGIRCIGKSRFILEYLVRRSERFLRIDLKTIDNVDSLYSVIITRLHAWPRPYATETNKWIEHILDTLKEESESKRLSLFLDNAESAFDDEHNVPLFDVCQEVIKACPHVLIFLTSTKRIHFAELGRVYCSYELKPLKPSESLELFRAAAPELDLGEFTDKIIELSEGIPLLILMICQEFRCNTDRGDNNTTQITPEQMVSLLLDSRLRGVGQDYFPEDENVVGMSQFASYYVINVIIIIVV